MATNIKQKLRGMGGACKPAARVSECQCVLSTLMEASAVKWKCALTRRTEGFLRFGVPDRIAKRGLMFCIFCIFQEDMRIYRTQRDVF